MPGKVIETSFNNGFSGHYAEQPDMVIKTFKNAGDTSIAFGTPVFSVSSGVAAIGATGLTAMSAAFKGVAASSIKSALFYPDQSVGAYLPEQVLPVFERGAVSVEVHNVGVNPPVIDGNVYVRIANGTAANPVGGFEAAADSANTIKIDNTTWGTTADVNGIAELVIKTRNNS